MTVFLQFLSENSLMLLTGSTAVLAVGAACVAIHRSPVKRQRAAELTVLATLCWLFLACLPLPRLSLERLALLSPAVRSAAPVDSLPEAELPLMPPSDGASEDLLPAMVLDGEGAGAIEFESELIATSGPTSPDDPLEAPAREVPAWIGLLEDDAEIGVAATAAASSSTLPPDAVPREAPPAAGRILVQVFLACAVACCVWLAVGYIALRRIVRKCLRPDAWLKAFSSELVCGRAIPQLWVSPDCQRALSFGIWRQIIVLPAALCEPRREEQLRHVLLHELAHVRRRDAWGRCLFNVAFPLLYFHPLYWWLRSTAEMSAELIADELAAAGSSREDYAEQLIALAREQGRTFMPRMAALQILGSHTSFYRRMNMLVRREQSLATRCGWGWRLVSLAVCLAMVIGGAALMGVDRLQADEAAPDDASNAVESPARAAFVDALRAGEPQDAADELRAFDPDDPLTVVEAQDPPPIEESFEAPTAEPAIEAEQAIAAEQAVEAERAAQARHAAAERRMVEHQLQATRAQLAEMEKLLTMMKMQMAGVLSQDRTTDADAEKLMRELGRHSQLLSQALERIEGLEARLGSRDVPRPGAPRAPFALVAPPADAPVLAQPAQPTQPTPDPVPTPKRRLSVPPIGDVPQTPHPEAVPHPEEGLGGRGRDFERKPVITVVPHPEEGPDGPRMHDAPGPGLQINLIELAEAYNAALEQREIVKVELDAAGDLPEDSRHTARRLAEVKLKSAERKLNVIRQIVETAIHGAESDLAAHEERFKRVETLANHNAVSQAVLNLSRNELVQAETRLKILKAIVAD